MRRVGACRATGGDDAITWKPSIEATARIQVERSGFAGRTESQTDTSPNAKPMWDVSQPKAGLPLAQSASSPSLAPIRPRPADTSQPPGGGDVREALRLYTYQGVRAPPFRAIDLAIYVLHCMSKSEGRDVTQPNTRLVLRDFAPGPLGNIQRAYLRQGFFTLCAFVQRIRL